MIAILKCSCSHAFQDARYGVGLRVHNYMTGGQGGWRCTVCQNEKPLVKEPAKAAK